MTVFVTVDAGDFVTGFYPNDIYGEDEIPGDAIRITRETYSMLLKGRATNKRMRVLPDGTPELSGPSVDELRNAAWDRIKADRDRRKTGGFKVRSLWFHSDHDSRIQHIGLKDKARDLLAAGGAMTDNLIILGQPVKWKTMDGSFATITAQLAFDIVAAAGDLDARLFAVAETHRSAMEAATDPTTYDFSVGWPETFGG